MKNLWDKVKRQAAELVLWAERELAGKTGAEKRRAVVKKLQEIIDWPVIPEFVENIFEPIIYGWIVDRVCGIFDVLTDKDFVQLALTPEQLDYVVEMVDVKKDGEPVTNDLILVGCAGDNVDDRLATMYGQYLEKKGK